MCAYCNPKSNKYHTLSSVHKSKIRAKQYRHVGAVKGVPVCSCCNEVESHRTEGVVCQIRGLCSA